jgi:hypothetical protein
MNSVGIKGLVKMRKILAIGFIILVSSLSNTLIADATVSNTEPETSGSTHNWVEYSTSYDTIEVGSHEYSYWKNFIRHTRTCHISHVIKTVVYYCDEHDHTKTETELTETIHSGNHR